jgi:hypothetical protein
MASDHLPFSHVPHINQPFLERRRAERRVSVAHRVSLNEDRLAEREDVLRELLDEAHERIRFLEAALIGLRERV